MSLRRTRKKLVAASLAAMTAMSAAVPALVVSAPAVFAQEQNLVQAVAEQDTVENLEVTQVNETTYRLTGSVKAGPIHEQFYGDSKGQYWDWVKEEVKNDDGMNFTSVKLIFPQVAEESVEVKQKNPAFSAFYEETQLEEDGQFSKDDNTWVKTKTYDKNTLTVTGNDFLLQKGQDLVITLDDGEAITIENGLTYQDAASVVSNEKTSTVNLELQSTEEKTHTFLVTNASPSDLVNPSTDGTNFMPNVNLENVKNQQDFAVVTVAFNGIGLTNEKFVIKQTNEAPLQWYGQDAWEAIQQDSWVQTVQGDKAVKTKVYESADALKQMDFMMVKGGTATFEIYDVQTLAEVEEAEPVATYVFQDGLDYPLKEAAGDVTYEEPTLNDDGKAVVSHTSMTVEAESGETVNVTIPSDDLVKYLQGGEQIEVSGSGSVELAPSESLTLEVSIPDGVQVESLVLPQEVVAAASAATLNIEVQDSAGATLYQWEYVGGSQVKAAGDVELAVETGNHDNIVSVAFREQPQAGWTFRYNLPGTGYRAYSDAAAQISLKNGVSISGKTVSITDQVEVDTVYFKKSDTSIPDWGDGDQTNVQLDTQIVYMINEVSVYDFLVKDNNDTDSITIQSSNEDVATVALHDADDARGAKYRVTTKGVGRSTITVTYGGESATMEVVVYPKGGSITLDTASYTMAPGNIYDIGVFVTDGQGNRLSGAQVQEMVQNGTLKVRDSRTGSIVDLQQLPNGNFRVTGKNEGVCYIMYEIMQDNQKVTHASVKIEVKKGAVQGGNAVRNTSWWADKTQQ